MVEKAEEIRLNGVYHTVVSLVGEYSVARICKTKVQMTPRVKLTDVDV